LRHYRLGAPLFPLLAAARRLPAADVVVSSSYAFAHHMRAANDAPQVCYCHSPLRFAWSMTEAYGDRWARGDLAARAFGGFAAGMRAADRRASRRVARYLTQSPFTAEQIQRFYGREAHVVGAPIACDRFTPSGRPADDYFLFVGRIVEPYKRLGITIEAFRRLGRRLVVAGDGPDLAELRRMAPANVTFTGHLRDTEVAELMRNCQATIFPSRDDFGLIPLEVNACGRPVLAYADGGALHTVVPGTTGELFAEQTAAAIEAAVRAFDPGAYDVADMRNHALEYDAPVFRRRVAAHVEAIVADR
jgi:glycosyltransferase involved in cell wall biosynthesis